MDKISELPRMKEELKVLIASKESLGINPKKDVDICFLKLRIAFLWGKKMGAGIEFCSFTDEIKINPKISIIFERIENGSIYSIGWDE